jgi:hypothetical protein
LHSALCDGAQHHNGFLVQIAHFKRLNPPASYDVSSCSVQRKPPLHNYLWYPFYRLSMSTRLIVKNLPKHADEARLKEHFQSHGDITDVKVLRKRWDHYEPFSSHIITTSTIEERLCLHCRDGQSRCFAFVGYKDASQAAKAQKYFDRSCLGTSRLSVSFADSFRSAGQATSARDGGLQHPADAQTQAATGADGDQNLNLSGKVCHWTVSSLALPVQREIQYHMNGGCRKAKRQEVSSLTSFWV